MAALRMDMMTRLANAPKKTVIRGCRVAMIAAIKNVLSPAKVSIALDDGASASTTTTIHVPISETTIMMKALNRAAVQSASDR